MLKKIFLALSCLVVAACHQNEVFHSSGALPIRFPIQLHQTNQIHSTNFEINKDGEYAIYLLFLRPNFKEQNQKNDELDNQLFNILSDLRYRDKNSKPSPEKIHFHLEVQDLNTQQIVIKENIDFEDKKFKQIVTMHDDERILAIITDINQDSRFKLNKGNYRINIKNQYLSTAYKPYNIQIQISKPYKIKH